MFLDASDQHEVDWAEIATILEDAFRHVAPKALIAQLDNGLPATHRGMMCRSRSKTSDFD